MKVIKTQTLFIALAVSFFLCGNLFAQTNLGFLDLQLNSKEQKSLIKSINLFTEKIRNQKWSAIYDLLSDKLKENWDSKEDFIQWQNEDRFYFVTDFKVKKDSILVWNDEKFQESVHLIGCISAVEDGKTIKYWGTLEAQRHGAEKWLFGSLPIINPNKLSGGRRPC